MNQQPFITPVDQILAAKQQPPLSPFVKGELSDADTSALEREIDKMVYALYWETEGLVYTLDKACFKGNMKNQNRRFCSVLQEEKKIYAHHLRA